MAGINNAMKRVIENRNIGTVVAKGTLKECSCRDNEGCPDCNRTKYIIIRLDHDGGLITEYDYGSDIHFENGIEVGNKVMLMINSNWNATWEKQENEDVRHSSTK